MDNRLLKKMQLKELSHMDISDEICELLSEVFSQDLQTGTSTAQEKATAIITQCLMSSKWTEQIYHLAGACKDCLSDLLAGFLSGLETEFSQKRFFFGCDVYIELSSMLSGILMEHTCEHLTPPDDFPKELSSVPFSNNVPKQLSDSILLLTQIQTYAREEDSDALAYCLQISFRTDLENIHIFDELERKYHACSD